MCNYVSVLHTGQSDKWNMPSQRWGMSQPLTNNSSAQVFDGSEYITWRVEKKQQLFGCF